MNLSTNLKKWLWQVSLQMPWSFANRDTRIPVSFVRLQVSRQNDLPPRDKINGGTNISGPFVLCLYYSFGKIMVCHMIMNKLITLWLHSNHFRQIVWPGKW